MRCMVSKWFVRGGVYDNKSLEYGLPSDMVKLLSSYYDLANERRLNFDYEIRRGECSTTEHNIFMTTELYILIIFAHCSQMSVKTIFRQ